MADGNPQNTLAAEMKVTNISEVLSDLDARNKLVRQNLANGEPLSDSGQATATDSVSEKPSPAPLQSTQMVTEHYTQEPSAGLHD